MSKPVSIIFCALTDTTPPTIKTIAITEIRGNNFIALRTKSPKNLLMIGMLMEIKPSKTIVKDLY